MEEAERSPPVDPDFFKLLEETLHDPDYEHIWGSTSDEPTHSTSHLQEPYTTTNNVSPFSHSVEDVHTVENVPSEPNTATDSTPFSLDNETVTIPRKYDVLPSMVPEPTRENLLQISKRYLPPEDEARGPARNRRRRNKTKAFRRFVQSLFKEAGTLPQKRSAADAFDSTASATPLASDTTQETVSHSVENEHNGENVPSEPNTAAASTPFSLDNETVTILRKYDVLPSMVPEAARERLLELSKRYLPPDHEARGPARNRRRRNKTGALSRFLQSVFGEAGTPPQERSAADAFESTANATPPASDTTQETNPLTFTFQEMVDKETKQMLLQIGLDVSVVVGNFRTLLAKIICRWRPPPGEVAGPVRNQRRLNKRRALRSFLRHILPTLTEPEEDYLGPMDVVCEHCGAVRFSSESPTFCCSNGSVKLPPLSTPAFGDGIFSDKEFRKNIRRYNSAFAFTSTRMKYDKELANSRKGVYSYIITGEVCHQIGPLLPEGAPKCLQRYFYSSEDQVKHRHQYDKELSQGRFIFVFSLFLFHVIFPDILASIGGYLEKNNRYVHHARDMLEISQTPPQF